MGSRRLPALTELMTILGVIAANGCADSDLPTAADDTPSHDIVDAPRSALGTGFYFLPPLVASPASFTGPFDPAANPVVEICVPFGKGCNTPLLARFTMGHGADNV